MGRPKRSVQAAAEDTLNPPDELTPAQSIARVVKAEGNNLYTCELPNKKTVVLELEPKFRNTVWLKRGGYVLIDVGSAEERKSGSRVVGEIINVVRDEKLWRKQAYWSVLIDFLPSVRGVAVLADDSQAKGIREENLRPERRRRRIRGRQDAAQ